MSDDVDRLKAQSDAIEQREEAARIEAAFEGWSPTASNVNALPEPLRGYIHQLETVCDPLKARVPWELTAVGSRHVSDLVSIT